MRVNAKRPRLIQSRPLLSAISFRLLSASIPADASSDSPLSSAFASNLSGPSIPRLAPLPFRFLTPSVSVPFRSPQFRVLTTQPLFFLSFSSRLRLTVASSVRPLRFRFLGFPRSLRPGFPCLPSRFLYSALLFVSFRPSLIRSHSCSSGAYLPLPSGIFRVPSASFRPLLLRFRLLSLLFLPFPALPGSASQWLPRCSSSAFASYVFPVLSCLVSRAFLLGFGTQLYCMFPFALP